jgi:hypothetical protein
MDMWSRNSFDSPVWKQLGGGSAEFYPSGDIGVEIELEGNLANVDVASSKYWLAKPEGSLRGGMEYIFRAPVPIKTVPLVAGLFGKIMDKSTPEISIRCSTHIHVNVTRLTVRELYNAIAGFYLFESLLVATQPPKRRGNLFCLQMEDTEYTFTSIAEHLEEETENVLYYSIDHNRYAALNLSAIQKFGSLEFRFLDAFTKPSDIILWSKVFYNLVHTLAKTKVKDLLKNYDEMTPREFVAWGVGREEAEEILKGFTDRQINKLLQRNYDYVFELANILGRFKYQTPAGFWDEDSDTLEKTVKKVRGLGGFVLNANPEIPLYALDQLYASAAGSPTPTDPDEGSQNPYTEF